MVRQNHLHYRIYPSRAFFLGTRAIFIRAVPKIFCSVNGALVHLQNYPRCLSENRLGFICSSTGILTVLVFDKYKRVFYNSQYHEQSGVISQTLARLFSVHVSKGLRGPLNNWHIFIIFSSSSNYFQRRMLTF